MSEKVKQEAFQAAYRACQEPFVRYCMALSYGKMDAEDLVQDVLLSAYQHFDRIQHKGNLLHYLIRAARNRSISRYRRSRFKGTLPKNTEQDLPANGLSPEDFTEVQLLLEAIGKLAPKEREALLLFELNGFKIREIAEIQHASEIAIKTKLSRARKKLRNRLDPQGPKRRWMMFLLGDHTDGIETVTNRQLQFDCLREIPMENKFLQFKLPSSPNPVFTWSISPFQLAILRNLAVFAVGFSFAGDLPEINSFALIPTLPVISEIQTDHWAITRSDIPLLTEGQKNWAPPSPDTSSELPPKNPQPQAVLPLVSHQKKAEVLSQRTNEFLLLPPSVIYSSTGIYPLDTVPSRSESIFQTTEAASPSLLKTKPGNCRGGVDVRWSDMAKLRKQLPSRLVADQIISSRKIKVRVSFADNKILVNQQSLPSDLQSAYKTLLLNRKVFRCPENIVEVTPEYIAVGRITPDGFKGKVSGRVELATLK